MNMNFKVKLNESTLDQLASGISAAVSNTLDELRKEVADAQVMPFREGNMQNDTFIDVQRNDKAIYGKLITPAPQARRLYYNPQYNFYQGHNANAGGMWYEDWSEGGEQSDRVREVMMQNLKEIGL